MSLFGHLRPSDLAPVPTDVCFLKSDQKWCIATNDARCQSGFVYAATLQWGLI
jgi:hypothetical protein